MKKYKGTDEHYVAVFATQYNSSLSRCVPNFKILSRVVVEYSLTDFFKNRQTNRQTDKHGYRKGKNYIPLYTSYRGYNKNYITKHEANTAK